MLRDWDKRGPQRVVGRNVRGLLSSPDLSHPASRRAALWEPFTTSAIGDGDGWVTQGNGVGFLTSQAVYNLPPVPEGMS